MRRVAVTAGGIMAILWGGLFALIGILEMALLGSTFAVIQFALGAFIAALGLVAIRRFG